MLENFNSEKSEIQLKRIELEVERLNREVKKYFENLGMTPQELEEFVCNPNNFTKEGWEKLEEERQKLEQEVEKQLSQVNNPSEAQKKYASLNIPPYAIFVR